MKTCPKCGNKLGDEALFCNNCGFTMSNVASDNGTGNPNPNPQPQPQPQAPNNGSWQNNGQQAYQQPYVAPSYDPADHTREFDPKDIADNKLYATLPYFFGILGIIPALLVKDSPFTEFHIKASIRLTLAGILLLVPCIIPVLGWIVSGIGYIVLTVLYIMAIVWVLQGKAKDIPIISKIGFLK